MTTQIATVAGINVIYIAGEHNFDFSKRCGAIQVFDHKDPDLVEKIIDSVGNSGQEELVVIFDGIARPDTYAHDLAILSKLGGGHLACVHPPPAIVPANVKASMIFAVNDIATPVWEDYVTPALQAGKTQCFPPPTVVGKGLEHIDTAPKMCKAGVSATKTRGRIVICIGCCPHIIGETMYSNHSFLKSNLIKYNHLPINLLPN